MTQHEYRSQYGRLRVTTDDFRETDGKSAWWLHSDSEEELFLLAKSILWCGDIGQKLRHWTKATEPVMTRIRAE